MPEFLFEGSILQEIQRYDKEDAILVRDWIRDQYSVNRTMTALDLIADFIRFLRFYNRDKKKGHCYFIGK